MSRWRVVVEAMPRPGVRDPQGDTVRAALAAAHPSLESVRVGRRVELVLEAPDRERALAEAQAACDELLVHPLLETAELHVEAWEPAGAPAGVSPLRVAVVHFPGSNCDRDTLWAFREVLGEEAVPVDHERATLPAVDLVVLPGGFSYGDYLRPGAVAARAPVMRAVRAHAAAGGLVLGICNGFQILCEAGLLPGALVRNESGRFVCRTVHLRVESDRAPLTAALRPGEVIRLPVAHGAGNYRLPPGEAERLAAQGRILLRYADARGEVTPEANPNGSEASIAGVADAAGNVMGLMPHPERAVAAWQGSVDGLRLLRSLLGADEGAERGARGPETWIPMWTP